MKIEKLRAEMNRIGSWGKLSSARIDIILKYAGKKILDAGCSSGDYVRFLLARGYDAYGLDIMHFEEWEGEFRNRFKRSDLLKIPFGDEEFDTVMAFEVLEHTEDIDTAMKEIKRIVRKNMILSVPDSELYPVFKESGLTFHHWVDRTHLQFFTEESLRRKLNEHGLSLHFFSRINPIYPERIFFENIGCSSRLAGYLTQIMRTFPFRKKYHMTLIAVANKTKS